MALFAQDTFTRTGSNGWGTADQGGAWVVVSGAAADFSTDGTLAVITPTTAADRRMRLDASHTDAEVLLKFRLTTLPTESAAEMHIASRYTDLSNYYFFRVQVSTAAGLSIGITKRVAAVNTNLGGGITGIGVTIAANDWVWVRAQTPATNIRIRVWKDGTAEPGTWNREVTDTDLANGTALAIVAGHLSATTAFPVWNFDDLTADDLAVPAQKLRPTADSVVGAYTTQAGGTTNLFDTIDEVTASDTDYVQSQTAPSSSVYRFKIGSGTDPVSSSGHLIRWRAGKLPTDGQQINATVRVYQGGGDVAGAGTLIKTAARTNVVAFTTYEETLSGAEADAITNYADLYGEFVATQV